MAQFTPKERRATTPTVKPDTRYTVPEKEQHYFGVIATSESVMKESEKSHKSLGYVSYGAGYVQAVADCRAALIKPNTAAKPAAAKPAKTAAKSKK